jgi:hypothetical protein
MDLMIRSGIRQLVCDVQKFKKDKGAYNVYYYDQQRVV